MVKAFLSGTLCMFPSHWTWCLEEYHHCRLPHPLSLPTTRQTGTRRPADTVVEALHSACVAGGAPSWGAREVAPADDRPSVLWRHRLTVEERLLPEQEFVLTGISPDVRLMWQLNAHSLGSVGKELILLLLVLRASQSGGVPKWGQGEATKNTRIFYNQEARILSILPQDGEVLYKWQLFFLLCWHSDSTFPSLCVH